MKWTSVCVIVACLAALAACTKWTDQLPVALGLIAVALAVLSLHDRD